MQLNHRFTVPARVEDVWAAFNQLKRVAPQFPGATIDSVRGDEFTGSIKIKFGPILLLYNGSGRIVERNQADRQLIIEARGRDRRGQGSATVQLAGRFLGLEDGGTEIQADTDLTLTGRPAQFGQALISEVVDRVLDRFVHGVTEQLTGRGPVPVSGPVDGVEAATDVPTEPAPEEVEAIDQRDVDRVGFGRPEDEAAEASEPVEVKDEDQAAEDPEDEPVIDPRGDDADFATVPPTATSRTAEAEPEPESTFESEDFLGTPPPHGAASSRVPDGVRPPGSVEPVDGSSGLRRYAPAAAAAVAGVTAVVVWALGRRRR